MLQGKDAVLKNCQLDSLLKQRALIWAKWVGLIIPKNDFLPCLEACSSYTKFGTRCTVEKPTSSWYSPVALPSVLGNTAQPGLLSSFWVAKTLLGPRNLRCLVALQPASPGKDLLRLESGWVQGETHLPSRASLFSSHFLLWAGGRSLFPGWGGPWAAGPMALTSTQTGHSFVFLLRSKAKPVVTWQHAQQGRLKSLTLSFTFFLNRGSDSNDFWGNQNSFAI